jgi:hypothetical protein
METIEKKNGCYFGRFMSHLWERCLRLPCFKFTIMDEYFDEMFALSNRKGCKGYVIGAIVIVLGLVVYFLI